MSVMCGYSWSKVCLGGLLVASCSCMEAVAVDRVSVKMKADSVERNVTFSEYTHIYKTRRVSSTYPVTIKMMRGALLVTSQHSQMLPVYKGNGVFYGLFRLNKGTNWINGLPKGVYIINNSKVRVS